ncbi:MAG: TetR/AcrR family transcriptional regulator [Microbacterium sp.]
MSSRAEVVTGTPKSDAPARAARSPRGSYAKGLARRQQIVDEALVVFGRSGYHSGSLREIAKRVGLTPTGLMHHFANKEELFTEVLRQRDEKIREAAGDPAEHTVIQQAMKVVAYNQQSPGLTSLYATVSAEATDSEHPAHEEFARRYQDSAANATPLLIAAQEDGEVRRDVDPELAARLISAVMDGIQQQWLLDDSVDMNALFAEFARGYLLPRDADDAHPAG